jgi:K+-transporting ATPase A subunit
VDTWNAFLWVEHTLLDRFSYENPTPLSNFLEMLAIVLVPAALTNTFGRMVGQ